MIGSEFKGDRSWMLRCQSRVFVTLALWQGSASWWEQILGEFWSPHIQSKTAKPKW